MEKKVYNFNGDIVSIPAKHLTNKHAQKALKEHYHADNMLVVPGLLVYPMLSGTGTKYNAKLVWKGEVSEQDKVFTIGFLGIYEGNFMDVPIVFSFIPLSGAVTQIGSAQCHLNGKGNIEVTMP